MNEEYKEIRNRITNYLGNGGFFNPEFMEHDKVRDLLMDIRNLIDGGGQQNKWVKTTEEWPDTDTPVLAVVNGDIRVAMLSWDYPSFEESYKPYQYWDDVYDDGQGWSHEEVTHWMSLPEIPSKSEINNVRDDWNRGKIELI